MCVLNGVFSWRDLALEEEEDGKPLGSEMPDCLVLGAGGTLSSATQRGVEVLTRAISDGSNGYLRRARGRCDRVGVVVEVLMLADGGLSCSNSTRRHQQQIR